MGGRARARTVTRAQELGVHLLQPSCPLISTELVVARPICPSERERRMGRGGGVHVHRCPRRRLKTSQEAVVCFDTLRTDVFANAVFANLISMMVRCVSVTDLEAYRGKGLQEGEVELQDEAEPAAGAGAGAGGAPPADEIDMAVVQQLMAMGFSENACKRATKAVSGAGVEAASNWMFGHMEDADFNDPLPEAAAADTAGGAGSGKPAISEDAIQMLCAIGGFAPRQAEAGLIACDGNNERAADWLFSRMDDLDTAVEAIFAKQAGDAAAGGGGGGGGGGGAGDAGGSGEPDDGPGKGREREGRGTGGEGKKEKVSTRKNVGAVHVCIDPPLVSRHPF